MSILKVAKIAGVSHTTVARAVNSPESVKEDTLERIRRAMKDAGYTPKPQSLRRGTKRTVHKGCKTGNVAFITSAQGFHILGYSPVMMNVVRGIDEALASYGMSMVQGVVNASRQLPPIVAKGGVDGVIIWPDLGDISRECLDILKSYRCVYVMTGRDKFLSGDRVMNNNERVGAIAADYLLSRGHKKLVYIDYDSQSRLRTAWVDRWYGFEDAALGACAEKLILDIHSNEVVTLRAATEQTVVNSLQNALIGSDNPTGAFVSGDSLTALIYPLLKRLGIEVGKDIEIVSCNNERSILAGLDPQPASIDICPEEIGTRAVEQLLWRVENPEDTSKVVIEIEPRLIKT